MNHYLQSDFLKMDKATQERMKFFDKYYEPLTTYHLNETDAIYLGSETNKLCRFCGKDSSETSFNKVAHAVPEFIGNKNLLTYYECDVCNSRFGQLLENDTASYFQLWHTLAQVDGKKGVPTTVARKSKSRVELGEKAMEVQEHEGDPLATIDEEKKTITFEVFRRPYTPVAIYKCLTKMALTIMPEEELVNFQNTMAWINELDHTSNPANYTSLQAFSGIAPGMQPYRFVSCMLFRRREKPNVIIPYKIEEVPYMLFLVAYSNFSLQIYLPFSKQDEALAGKELTMMLIPTPIDMVNGSSTIKRETLDLNGEQVVKGDKAKMVMSYEDKIELDIKEDSTEK